MSNVDKTLTERGKKYGDFTDIAMISQTIQRPMRATPGWNKLTPDKREALQTIASKIARILNGDPDYKDNWHDIAGYAKLVEDQCKTPTPKIITGTGIPIREVSRCEYCGVNLVDNPHAKGCKA